MADREFPCDWCGGGGIDMQQGNDVPCWFCRGTGRTSIPRSTSAPHDTETLAEVLRGCGFWATHSDRWNDKAWQDELWSTLARAVVSSEWFAARIVQARAGEGALREQIEAWWLAEDGVTLDHAAAQGIGRAVRLRAALLATEDQS